MSLTSILRERDVRERFTAEFRKPKVILNAKTYAAPTIATGAHAALVGTAFDYVVRLYVSIINEVVWDGEWIAEVALDRLALKLAQGRSVFPPGSKRKATGLLSKARRFLSDARATYERCQRTSKITDAMCSHAVVLAQLEQFYRCGLLSENFGKPNLAAVADLRSLLKIVSELECNSFIAKRVCVLNPSFNSGSDLVGGADADLLLDDILIDVKTTKHLEFTAEMFRQMMGYYTLYRMSGLNEEVRPKPDIKHLAVYFARHGVLVSIPAETVVNRNTFGEFMGWFETRASNGCPLKELVLEDGTIVQY